MQVVGAAAGIGAWIAVVGGARLWARLHAIDVPTAQTVSILPRQLLIAEGLRTLLVPLLLGAAIAVLVYLSRPRLATPPAQRRPRAPDPAAAEAADRALARSQQASGRAADKRAHTVETLIAAREAARDTDRRIEPVVAEARRDAAATRTLEREAARRADDARAAAETAGRPTDRLERIRGEHAMWADRFDAIHGRLRDLRSTPPAGEGRRDRLRSDFLEALNTIDYRHLSSPVREWSDRPMPLEGGRRLWAAMLALAPVEYVRSSCRTLDREFGRGVVVALVVVAVLAWALVAVVLLHPSWTWVGITAAAAVSVTIVLLWRLPDWGFWAALLAGPLCLTVALFTAVRPQYVFAVAVLSVVTIYLTLGAMSRCNGPGGLAWVLFAAIAFWSGCLAFVGELGAWNPQLETAVVMRKSAPVAAEGLFLGRTADDVFLASGGPCRSVDDCRRVLSLSTSDVTCIAFGPRRDVDDPLDVDTRLAVFAAGGRRAGVCATAKPAPKPKPKPKPGPSPSPQPVVTPDGSHGNRPVRPVRLVLDSDVLFRFRSATLTPAAKGRIRRAAAAVRATGATRVFIAGHTDSRGSRARNRRLSARRAEAVRDLLIGALEPARPTLDVRAYGETRPLACNRRPDGSDDPVARAYNRRVELWVGRAPRYPRLSCPG